MNIGDDFCSAMLIRFNGSLITLTNFHEYRSITFGR